MANLTTILTVQNIQIRLFRTLHEDHGIDALLHVLASFKSSSREINQFLHDETIVKLFSIKLFAPVNERFQHVKIKNLIYNNNWNGFQALIELLTKYNGAGKSRDLVKQYLLYAIKHATTEFLSKLLRIQIQGNAVQFPKNRLIRSLEYSVKNKLYESAAALLPCLQTYFKVSDPDLFQRLDVALKNKQNLNLTGDVIHKMKNSESSQIFSELLKPYAQKIIIPEGNLLTCSKLKCKESIYVYRVWWSISTKYKSHTKALRWIIGSKSNSDANYSIIYYDSKGLKRETNIQRKELSEDEYLYSYEGLSTTSIYEVIIRTSLGEEILRSFPHRFVAVTDQVLELPLENQPWYFGNISDEEAQEILLGAAGTNFFLTLSRGLQFYIYWSEPKRRPLKFLKGEIEGNLKEMIESAMKKMNGALGIYNEGSRRGIEVLKFLQILTTSSSDNVFELARQFKIQNNIEIATIQPSPLWVYMKNTCSNELPNELLKWLIDEGANLYGDETPSLMALAVSKKGIDYGKYLLSLGVLCDTSAFIALLDALPHYDDFKLFWQQRKPNLNFEEILTKLSSLAGSYERRWGNGRQKWLVLLAWRFGNHDNLFKKLPKELVQLILRYDDMNDPHWYSIGKMILLDHPQQGQALLFLRSVESLPFILKYRSLFHAIVMQNCMSMIFSNYFRDPRIPDLLRKMRQLMPNLKWTEDAVSFPLLGSLLHTLTDLKSALEETKLIDMRYFKR